MDHLNQLLRDAASSGNIRDCLALIEQGVNPDGGNSTLKTALHLAAMKGYGNICAVLLEAGAQVNCRDYDQLTPLHYAVWRSQHDATLVLLERGADLHAVDQFGQSPLMYDARNKETRICIDLLARGAGTQGELARALNKDAELGYSEKCLLLLEAGADTQYIDPYSEKTALELAIRFNHAHTQALLRSWCAMKAARDVITELTSSSSKGL